MADLSQLTPEQQRDLIEEVVRRVTERLAPGSSLPSGPSSPLPTGATTESMRAMAAGGVARFGTNGQSTPACQTLGSMIDHTLLKPNVRPADIEKLCAEAREHRFASVCVNPTHVHHAAELLHGSGVKVCTVIGFPLGATSTESKAFETRQAIVDGAEEIDMVINVGLLRAGEFAAVFRDIEAVVSAAQGRTVKVILETCELTDEEKVSACVLCKAAGAHFVKTSTGFGSGGATPEDIALMRRVVGPKMGVKASGGIRDCDTAQEMIRRGASRLGVSASIAIVQGAQGEGSY